MRLSFPSGSATLLSIAVALLAPPADAGTLRVGPTRAFTDIQSAVNAASDGDLILVDPGTYEPFTIAFLGVSVQGDPSFTVDDSSGDGTVRIGAVPAASQAAIRGMTMASVAAAGVGLEVEFCAGEVVLEQISITDRRGNATLNIDQCMQVFATDLTVNSRPQRLSWPPTPVPVVIRSSNASLHQLTVDGGGWYESVRIEGGAEAVLSGPQITAGHGIDSAGCLFDPDGGIGGAGVIVDGSTLIATGLASHFVRGGDGGVGSACGVGGTGGPGVVVQGASTVVIPARLTVDGGAGGLGGTGNGTDGLPISGTVDRSLALPHLELGELLVGAGATLQLDASPTTPGPLMAWLVVSGRGSFVRLPAFEGPPLSVRFGVPQLVLVRTTSPLGDLTVNATLPPDPALQGFLLHVQSAVVDPFGPEFLSNVVVRAVGM